MRSSRTQTSSKSSSRVTPSASATTTAKSAPKTKTGKKDTQVSVSSLKESNSETKENIQPEESSSEKVKNVVPVDDGKKKKLASNSKATSLAHEPRKQTSKMVVDPPAAPVDAAKGKARPSRPRSSNTSTSTRSKEPKTTQSDPSTISSLNSIIEPSSNSGPSTAKGKTSSIQSSNQGITNTVSLSSDTINTCLESLSSPSKCTKALLKTIKSILNQKSGSFTEQARPKSNSNEKAPSSKRMASMKSKTAAVSRTAKASSARQTLPLKSISAQGHSSEPLELSVEGSIELKKRLNAFAMRIINTSVKTVASLKNQTPKTGESESSPFSSETLLIVRKKGEENASFDESVLNLTEIVKMAVEYLVEPGNAVPREGVELFVQESEERVVEKAACNFVTRLVEIEQVSALFYLFKPYEKLNILFASLYSLIMQ
jgi:trimeric autotransporter adhesin